MYFLIQFSCFLNIKYNVADVFYFNIQPFIVDFDAVSYDRVCRYNRDGYYRVILFKNGRETLLYILIIAPSPSSENKL